MKEFDKTLFSERLASTLSEKGMTQKKLSDLSGVSEGTISRYMNGKRDLESIAILYDICRIINVSSDYLLGLSTPKGVVLSGAEKAILQSFTRASVRDRELVLQILADSMSAEEKGLFYKERNENVG